MTEVMTYSTSTFHQLNLLFINLNNRAITICTTILTNNKAVAQTGNLKIVSDTSHWATSRHNILEIAEQFKQFCL